MKITIVGGGNMGTLMAAEFASLAHSVTVYTSRPESWQKHIYAKNSDGETVYEGDVERITDDIALAADADYIFVTLPSTAQKAFVDKMLPVVKKGVRIGIVPGYGGAEFVFKPLVDKGVELFGFQRVHAITRLENYGCSVCMKGRKDSVFLSALDPNKTETICNDMEKLFSMPCIALPSYLCVTLTPSNPVLHTSRLYSMFKNVTPKSRFDRNIPFYEEWTDDASEILLKADDELQKICRAMSKAELSSVRSLKDHYESYTVGEMTDKIRSIKAFVGIGSPMKELDGEWVPDFESRYFTCDFAYGLDLLCQFGDRLSVDTPTMDAMMEWYRSVSGNTMRAIDLGACGIESLGDIYGFYRIS